MEESNARQLKDMAVTEFIGALASGAPAPGGGSASALAGAVGAALASMVSALTLGREKYKEHEALAREAGEKAMELSRELSAAIDKDAAAYNGVAAVFSMPKSTDGEKAARREAMQAALKAATEPPFEVMLLGLAALECVEKLLGRSNASAVSDLGVAALNLKSAIQGAWLNVLTNLAAISDGEFNGEYRRRGKEVLTMGAAMADRIYGEVSSKLGGA